MKPKPTPSQFGRRLRELRTAAGLSMSELARMAKVSRQAIHQFETGNSREPLFSVACRLADALGVLVTAFR